MAGHVYTLGEGRVFTVTKDSACGGACLHTKRRVSAYCDEGHVYGGACLHTGRRVSAYCDEGLGQWRGMFTHWEKGECLPPPFMHYW